MKTLCVCVYMVIEERGCCRLQWFGCWRRRRWRQLRAELWWWWWWWWRGDFAGAGGAREIRRPHGWDRHSAERRCTTYGIFDMPNPNLDSDWIWWNRQFSALIQRIQFWPDSLAKQEVLSSRMTSCHHQRKQTTVKSYSTTPTIQTIWFASESKSGFTMNLNSDSVKSNMALLTVWHLTAEWCLCKFVCVTATV